MDGDETKSDGPKSRRIHPEARAYIGRRIGRLRNQRGWTFYRLEKETGIGRKNLQAIEEGQYAPSLRVLLRLAEAFELNSIEEVIGGPLGTRAIRLIETGKPPPVS